MTVNPRLLPGKLISGNINKAIQKWRTIEVRLSVRLRRSPLGDSIHSAVDTGVIKGRKCAGVDKDIRSFVDHREHISVE